MFAFITKYKGNALIAWKILLLKGYFINVWVFNKLLLCITLNFLLNIGTFLLGLCEQFLSRLKIQLLVLFFFLYINNVIFDSFIFSSKNIINSF